MIKKKKNLSRIDYFEYNSSHEWVEGVVRETLQVKTSNHVCCWGSPSVALAVGEVLYSRTIQRAAKNRISTASPGLPLRFFFAL